MAIDYFKKKNQHSAELLGNIICLHPFTQNTSSPRLVMFSGHLIQRLCVKGATPRKIKTGMEYQYGEGTFDISAPCTLRVLKVIPKFTRGYGDGGIRENPMWYVLYEDKERRNIGVFEISKYHVMNHTLGFEYIRNPRTFERLFNETNPEFQEGEWFCRSPDLTDTGDWKYGVELVVAPMTIPEVEEDGMVITEEAADMLTTLGFEDRIASWDGNKIPLNLYGTVDRYKAFPEVGEKIRDDGVLMALRRLEPGIALANMSPEALMQIDPIFDDVIYAEKNATVVNVTVMSDRNRDKRSKFQSQKHTDQFEKYANATSEFARELVEFYHYHKRRNNNQEPPFTHRLNFMVADALAELGGINYKFKKDNIKRTHRKNDIGEWRATFTYRRVLVPGVRNKITDTSGGKGVIVSVIPTADAPVDGYGNRAHVICHNIAEIKRLIFGRPMEQYFNFINASVTRELQGYRSVGDYEMAAATLMRFYEAVSVDFYHWMLEDLADPAEMRAHIDHVCEVGFAELIMPSDREIFGAEQVRRVRAAYPDVKPTPVTYRGANGEMVTTREPVMLASIYMMLLEKTGDYWAACSVPKFSHFGTLSTLSSHDKYGSPYRIQPIKGIGEAETRLALAAVGPEGTTRMNRLSNSPVLLQNAQRKIIRAEDPMDIDDIIGPEGATESSRMKSFALHMLENGGKTIVDKETKNK